MSFLSSSFNDAFSFRYNHREYKGATTWIEPEASSNYQFSEIHLKGAARLAFMDKPGSGRISVGKFIGQPNSFIFVGVGQQLQIARTNADLSFNIRVYEDALLTLPFKLFVHGVSVHIGNNSKVFHAFYLHLIEETITRLTA